MRGGHGNEVSGLKACNGASLLFVEHPWPCNEIRSFHLSDEAILLYGHTLETKLHGSKCCCMHRNCWQTYLAKEVLKGMQDNTKTFGFMYCCTVVAVLPPEQHSDCTYCVSGYQAPHAVPNDRNMGEAGVGRDTLCQLCTQPLAAVVYAIKCLHRGMDEKDTSHAA